jgi:hypothetical protein
VGELGARDDVFLLGGASDDGLLGGYFGAWHSRCSCERVRVKFEL